MAIFSVHFLINQINSNFLPCKRLILIHLNILLMYNCVWFYSNCVSWGLFIFLFYLYTHKNIFVVKNLDLNHTNNNISIIFSLRKRIAYDSLNDNYWNAMPWFICETFLYPTLLDYYVFYRLGFHLWKKSYKIWMTRI